MILHLIQIKMKQFLKYNKWALVVGLFVYLIFLWYSFTGNRFCDCTSTEKYNSKSSNHGTANRFYHK